MEVSMPNEHLATYLNDHLAGSVVAIELLERLEATDMDMTATLAQVRVDIEADRAELRELMRRLHIAESRPRKLSGWFAEKFTQLKLRLDDPAGGSLRLLESLELVGLGIDGKVALWRALSAAAEVDPALKVVAYERLVQRAQDQRQRVEGLRLEAAKAALVGPTQAVKEEKLRTKKPTKKTRARA
jgi:hypothetical protein